MKEQKFRITGNIVPMISHNSQLANPLNRYSKAMKALTGKRKKTDQDIEDIARGAAVLGTGGMSDGESRSHH